MNMIAKFKVTKLTKQEHNIELEMMAVTDAPFDKEGSSEDNSFARWTPSGTLKMSITNPNLRDTMKEGEKYYLRFEKADK